MATIKAPKKLIEVALPLDDINNAFDLMHSGESIRSVVVYD